MPPVKDPGNPIDLVAGGFYRALGEPEPGFLSVRELDEAMAEGLGPDLEFSRTQTLMQGASHCDFRYRRRE